MKDIKYENIGNISEDYEHKPRIVNPTGLIVNPHLVLKMYYMLKEDTNDFESFGNVEKFLTTELNKKRLAPLVGLGFAMLSEDMLSVSRWDTKYPQVIKNQLYEYSFNQRENLISTAQKLDVKECGDFCSFELGIVSHEKDAWEKYLVSKHTNQDKKQYLENMFEGYLGVVEK